LTCGLQLQEPALRDFIDRVGTLPRGTGFLAHFLISWPASTQGTRAYQEPAAMQRLEVFRVRILRLLNLPIPIQQDGTLKPATAFLGDEAKQEWIAFHDAVESELRDGGELRDIRDVGSKAAENAARLAAHDLMSATRYAHMVLRLARTKPQPIARRPTDVGMIY
jgi:putative DNA primase/helicase